MAGRAERQERGGAGTPPVALESASSFETERVLRTTSSRGGFLQRLLSQNESAASYFSVPTDLDDGFDDKDEAQSRKKHHRWVPEEEAPSLFGVRKANQSSASTFTTATVCPFSERKGTPLSWTSRSWATRR